MPLLRGPLSWLVLRAVVGFGCAGLFITTESWLNAKAQTSACHCLSSEDAMAYDVPPPEQCPEPGYYYHYKHDPNGPLNNYAYYIYGVGHHTEDDCRPEDAFMQVYRPLYETAYAYRNGGMFDLRPLYMFYKPAIVNGIEVPRFTKITDPEVIARLGAIKARMYPDP